MAWACQGFAQNPYAPNQQSTITALSGSVMTQSISGWNITVDSRWLDGWGYRPIRISVTPSFAVSADRDLLIRVKTEHCYNVTEPLIVTEKYLSVPSGTQPGQTIKMTISAPPAPLEYDNSIEIIDPATTKGTVFQQGQIKGIGSRMGIADLSTVLSKYPHILFVGNAVPKTSAITIGMPPLQTYQGYQGNVPGVAVPQGGSAMPDGTIIMPDGSIIPNTVKADAPAGDASQGDTTAEKDATPKIPDIPLPSAMAVAAADLPETWIDYSSLDIVCLSLDQLADLAKKHPAAYRAILEWTAAGGNLWVCGLSRDENPWDRLGELNQLLKLDAMENASQSKIKASGWSEPGDEGAEFLQPSDGSTMLGAPRGTPPGYGSQPPVENAVKNPVSASKQPILIREYGTGTVSVISTANPFSGESKWNAVDWSRLFHTIGVARWQWNLRHGTNIGQQNPEFWNFLIPGVGLAPVKTFQVFITLFVLGIGPLNYWLLRRRKRLHLMVLTVPLSAAAVTGLRSWPTDLAFVCGHEALHGWMHGEGKPSLGRGSPIMQASRHRRALCFHPTRRSIRSPIKQISIPSRRRRGKRWRGRKISGWCSIWRKAG
jgi:hypothetical protein